MNSEYIDSCFRKSLQFISNLNSDVFLIDGMSGKVFRCFLHNLCEHPNTCFLEIGSWKGSTLCSAMNENNVFFGIDNFSQFGNVRNIFYENFNKFKGKNSHFIENDCFQLNLNLDYTFNVFFFDGDHTLEAHTKSLVYFYNLLDNEFVFIVDDWNWQFVREGTYKSIELCNLKIKYKKEILTDYNDRNYFWNGVCIFILIKQMV